MQLDRSKSEIAIIPYTIVRRNFAHLLTPAKPSYQYDVTPSQIENHYKTELFLYFFHS